MNKQKDLFLYRIDREGGVERDRLSSPLVFLVVGEFKAELLYVSSENALQHNRVPAKSNVEIRPVSSSHEAARLHQEGVGVVFVPESQYGSFEYARKNLVPDNMTDDSLAVKDIIFYPDKVGNIDEILNAVAQRVLIVLGNNDLSKISMEAALLEKVQKKLEDNWIAQDFKPGISKEVEKLSVDANLGKPLKQRRRELDTAKIDALPYSGLTKALLKRLYKF